MPLQSLVPAQPPRRQPPVVMSQNWPEGHPFVMHVARMGGVPQVWCAGSHAPPDGQGSPSSQPATHRLLVLQYCPAGQGWSVQSTAGATHWCAEQTMPAGQSAAAEQPTVHAADDVSHSWPGGQIWMRQFVGADTQEWVDRSHRRPVPQAASFAHPVRQTPVVASQ